MRFFQFLTLFAVAILPFIGCSAGDKFRGTSDRKSDRSEKTTSGSSSNDDSESHSQESKEQLATPEVFRDTEIDVYEGGEPIASDVSGSYLHLPPGIRPVGRVYRVKAQDSFQFGVAEPEVSFAIPFPIDADPNDSLLVLFERFLVDGSFWVMATPVSLSSSRMRIVGSTLVIERNHFGEFQLGRTLSPVANQTAAAECGCATGYVCVPGSTKFNTTNFCVMKYEAKKLSDRAVSTADDTPWVNISQLNAIAECSSAGGHLITQSEWMTLARNIESTPINDIDAASGVQLAVGHTDSGPDEALSAEDLVPSKCDVKNELSAKENALCELRGGQGYAGTENSFREAYQAGLQKSQLRIHMLNNGEVVWDISGNVREFVNALWTGEGPVDTPFGDPLTYENGEYEEWTSSRLRLVADRLGPTVSLSAAAGVGQYYLRSEANAPIIRGGHYRENDRSGIFNLVPELKTKHEVNPFVGFRCVTSPN